MRIFKHRLACMGFGRPAAGQRRQRACWSGVGAFVAGSAVLAVLAVLATVSPASAARVGRFAYIANFDSNTVSVIDIANSATVTVGVGANPAGAAIADVEEPPGPRPAAAGPGDCRLPEAGARPLPPSP
jgi:YVTN family beta-propeller protein